MTSARAVETATGLWREVNAAVGQLGRCVPAYRHVQPLRDIPERNTSDSGSPMQYIGGYRVAKAASELCRLGSRYYDPALGRFTQVDPTFQDANPYSYAKDNPISNSDASGNVATEFIDLLFYAWDLFTAGQAIGSGTAEAIASYAVSFAVSAITDAVCLGILAAGTAGLGAAAAATGCGSLGEPVGSAVLGFT